MHFANFQGKLRIETTSISLEEREKTKDKKTFQTKKEAKNRYLEMRGGVKDEKSQNETHEVPDAFQQFLILAKFLLQNLGKKNIVI